jgi:hypothetical protein
MGPGKVGLKCIAFCSDRLGYRRFLGTLAGCTGPVPPIWAFESLACEPFLGAEAHDLRNEKARSTTLPHSRTGHETRFALLPAAAQVPMVRATVENKLLVFVPTELIAIRQTAMITPNMTEYSTAVGPSSDRTNCVARWMNRCMTGSSSFENGKSRDRVPRTVDSRARL